MIEPLYTGDEPKRRLRADSNMTNAVNMWYLHALQPGSCTELVLRGQYDEALLHAHVNIRPIFGEFIEWVELYVPDCCKNENYDKWRGIDYYNQRHEFNVDEEEAFKC